MIQKMPEKLLKCFMVLHVILFLWPFGSATAGSVKIVDGDFLDAGRNREVPYRVYFPESMQGRYPAVIFSHGLGGSRYAAAYLGKYLAGNGYIALHIQHPGSDVSVWRNAGSSREDRVRAMEASLRNPRNAINRFQDIPFVLNQLGELNVSDPVFRGHMDMDRIGMAGHSYGGRSTMFAAGERIGLQSRSFKDPRIRAGVILSPNLPRRNVDLHKTYEDIDIPLFHVTGTRDSSPLRSARGSEPAQRTRPYQHINNNIPQYLLVLDQADHMTFSGRRMNTPEQKADDRRHLSAVQRGVQAFYDAYLKGDRKALQWLRTEFIKTLSKADRFEWKPRAAQP